MFFIPVSLNESVFELSVLPVSVTKLSAPVSVNAPDFELSVSPITTNEPDYELFACSVVIREITDELVVFPALELGAIRTLSVLCVSVFPRSQFLPWSSVPSALSVPPWWSSVWLWWSSAPPWWAPVKRRSSDPPWCSALPALPQPPVSPFPHGPGPPTLPLFFICSTWYIYINILIYNILDCFVWSVWKLLLRANLVRSYESIYFLPHCKILQYIIAIRLHFALQIRTYSNYNIVHQLLWRQKKSVCREVCLVSCKTICVVFCKNVRPRMCSYLC